MAKLHVGDKLPNFEFKNAYDVTKTVEKDVLGKKTVFWVIRYIGCTICRYDVHVLAQLHEQFKAKGVQVFVVMQSDPAIVREELKEANIPFDIVCDPAMAIYKQFEIPCAADKAELGGNEAQMARLQVKGAAAKGCGFVHGAYEGDEMQLPAVWVIEADGTLSYCKYAEAVADIPTPAELLEIL